MRKKKRGVTIQVIDRAAQRGLYAFIFALQTQLLNRPYKPDFTRFFYIVQRHSERQQSLRVHLVHRWGTTLPGTSE
jgi:hypothetical protein